MKNSPEQIVKDRPKRRRWPYVLLGVVILLLIVRLMLPWVVLKFVNREIAGLEEYFGHVEDVNIAVIRGAYKIRGIELRKIDKTSSKQDTTPFFKSPEIDLSVEWRSLFKGKVVGEITVESPIVNFEKGRAKPNDVKDDTTDFRVLIKSLMPLTINHFEINNGEIHYIDKYSQPLVDVSIKKLMVKADNLTNVNDSAKTLPAALKATGEAYGGHFDLNVKFNALEEQATFDLNTKITDVDMVQLNDFFKAYGKFDVEKGKFGMYTELAAKEGSFKGYVKPLMKDVKVLDLDKEEGNIFQILYEGLIGSIKTIFENQPRDQVATKLPLEGRFDNPEAGLWTAINYVLRNAFVMALQPSIDNTINIGNVHQQKAEKKNILQKVFGNKKEKEEGK